MGDTPPRIFTLEEAHDSGDLDSLSEGPGGWPAAVSLLGAFAAGDWPRVYREWGRVFGEAAAPAEKAFALQWAVAASEIEYDLNRRAQFLRARKDIAGAGDDPYCQYLRDYQDGVTLYFESSFRDAEIRFARAFRTARNMGYDRGRMRAGFHLGLVERYRGNTPRAREFYADALLLARERRAVKYAGRIEGELRAIGVTSADLRGSNFFGSDKLRLTELLREGHFAEARTELASLELARRATRIGRRFVSLAPLLALNLIGRGRERQGLRMIEGLADPVVKLEALVLKRQIFGLSAAETIEVGRLQEVIGISRIGLTAGSGVEGVDGVDGVEIAGIKLGSIPNREIQTLILLLLSARKPLSKEEIFTGVWKMRYDPTIHDGKLYRLVQYAKRAFKMKDLILNDYGTYRIHPDFACAMPGVAAAPSQSINDG